MNDAPILICYDGSQGARHAIEAAAELLVDRRAVVLDVGPLLTTAESYATIGVAIPDFEELNAEDAQARAEAGAKIARSAGWSAEARGEVDAPTWEGVVDVADEIGAAAIVLGSRGLNGRGRAAEGQPFA